jgi:D-alanyl-D-alanine dipeptidase
MLHGFPNAPEPFHLLNKIPVCDNGEPLVDLREACPALVLKAKCLPYVRSGIAERLNAAAKSLPAGHRFQVWTALRTLEMQSELYWTNFNKLKEERPDLPLSALRRRTNKFFAPPDYKAPPGHTTGGAVDLTILAPDGQPLDMVSPTEGWEGAATFSPKIGDTARANRLLLATILFGVGFSNCRDEWWHWSYGDSAWAVRLQKETACYGLILPPVGYTVIPDSE